MDTLHLLSHHPQGLRGDRLGFVDYARTVHEILACLTANQTGLTIGVFGDWGSGKSTVLTMVGELLDAHRSRRRTGRKRWLKGLRGAWYRSFGKRSRKGKLLEAVRSQRINRRYRGVKRLSRSLRVRWYRFFSRRSRQGRLARAVCSPPTPKRRQEQVIKPRRYRPFVVRFDAWKYSNEQVWVALLRTIVQEINAHQGPVSVLFTKLGLWRRRLDWNRLGAFLFWLLVRFGFALALLTIGVILVRSIGQQADWFNQFVSRLIDLLGLSLIIRGRSLCQLVRWLETALGLSSTAAAMWILLSTVVQRLWKGAKWVLAARITLPSRVLRATLDKETLYAVEQFRWELEDLIRGVGWRRPIVVLMDDLDRVPVDQIVPILEAMKHLSTKPDKALGKHPERRRAPIAFVFAADRQVLQRAIASHHKDFLSTLAAPEEGERFAREYLEKIVQISFELPPLSRSRLLDLLRVEGFAWPREIEGIADLPLARQRARQVFAQGPKENPRQVIQAFNSFQVIWRIVQSRLLQDVHPELLAALILVRYVWPETFEQICSCPELFFYLHALATHEENDECKETEIEELISLGCPNADGAIAITAIQSEQPDLLSFLSTFILPKPLDVIRLVQYITLLPDLPIDFDFHRIECGAALMSGDPSLIRFIARISRREVYEKRLLWLTEFIEPGIASSSKFGDRGQSAEDRMLRALFALGRVGDDRVVEPIARVIERRGECSTAVLLRAVYALAHLAKRGWDPDTAHRALIAVLRDRQTSLSLRVRILRLLGSTLLGPPGLSSVFEREPEARRPIVYLALRDPLKIVRTTALEFVRQGGWLQDAFAVLQDGPQTKEALEAYLEIVPTCFDAALPSSAQILEHLVELAADSSSDYQEQVLVTLTRLSDPGTVVRAMAEIVSHTADPEILKAAIPTMGDRQAVSRARWQTDAWATVEQALGDKPPEIWVLFVRALGKTGRAEAVPFLERAQGHRNIRVHQAAREEWEIITEGEESSDGAADARTAMDKQGNG